MGTDWGLGFEGARGSTDIHWARVIVRGSGREVLEWLFFKRVADGGKCLGVRDGVYISTSLGARGARPGMTDGD